MEAYLDWQKKSGGIRLNDVIEEFKYVYKGQEIKAGDFVNYINGVASKKDYGESVDTQLSTEAQTGYVISAVKLDDSRVFIAHSYGSNYHLYGVIVTIDGASITYGTDTKIDGTSHSGYVISACLLPNGNVFIAHSSSGSYYLYGIVVSIDGTTITYGTDTEIAGASYTGYTISTCLLPNGNVFIAHSDTSTKYRLAAIVCTISGTTIAKGTDTSINSSTNYTGYTISTCLLPNGNVFIAHSYDSSYYLYGMVCSISGTTITAGSDTAIHSVTYSGGEISTVVLPDGKVFIAHDYDTKNYLYGTLLTINGTSITSNGAQMLVGIVDSGHTISTVLLPSGEVFVTHGILSNNNYLYGIVVSISDTTINKGVDTQLSSIGNTGYEISSLLLDNGTIFTAHSYTSDYSLYAQIFGIDYDNNIPTKNIVITQYEQQVTPAIEPPFNAVALSSGVGGTDTEHNEQVKIARVGIKVEKDVLQTGNIFPTSGWVKGDSSTIYSTTDGWVIESDSIYSVGAEVDKVFDNNVNTSYVSSPTSGISYDAFILVTCPKPIKITKMKYNVWIRSGYEAGNLLKATIQGSHDKSTWYDLFASTTPQTSDVLLDATLDNTDYYQYYRLYIDGKYSDSHFCVSEWQTVEYSTETVTEVV